MVGELSARSRRKATIEGDQPTSVVDLEKGKKGRESVDGVLIWVDDEAAQQLFTRPKKKEKRKQVC